MDEKCSAAWQLSARDGQENRATGPARHPMLFFRRPSCVMHHSCVLCVRFLCPACSYDDEKEVSPDEALAWAVRLSDMPPHLQQQQLAHVSPGRRHVARLTCLWGEGLEWSDSATSLCGFACPLGKCT